MTCAEYTKRYFFAHADDELIGRDRRAADDHTGGCARCRTRLAEERRLKELIRTQCGAGKVPPDVRLRIRAALGEITEAEPEVAAPRWRRAAKRVASWSGEGIQRIGRRRVWIGVAAAMVAVASLTLSSKTQGPASIVYTAVPANGTFDYAVRKYDALSQEFVANAPAEGSVRGSDYAWVIGRESHGWLSDESADLAEAYRDADVPEDIYDFEGAGYRLSGGRIDMQTNGWPATFTLYRSEKGELVSICIHAPNFYAPIGARYWVGSHTFYEYQGHSLALTFLPNHYVSILIADEPVPDLLRDVTGAQAFPDA